MKRSIAILGAGNMASALALLLARHTRPVRMYCVEPEVENDIRQNHRNAKYLAGHRFPANVTADHDLAAVVEAADAVFVAVPSFAVREVLLDALPHLATDAVVASISKGLDPKTLDPLVVSESHLLPLTLRRRVCVIGGPAVATEMARNSPTGLVIASADKQAAETIRRLLQSENVKVATSHDVLGVGLASALKNVYAIALGMCDGLKLPANAKALLFTIALEETAQLLANAGAQRETAFGLAGLGDLIVTGLSPHGRNRTYGERLVNANTKDPSVMDLATVEGIAATALAMKLCRRTHIHAPLLQAIDRCLRARKDYASPFVAYLKHMTLA